MKEHFQDYGIRKWAGNDLIELQSEPLEALQKLVEPYAPCILQGCKTTGNEDGSITVEAGLVALQGKDFKGEDCVKIVRFAGVADTKPPIYITLECEPESRVYGDSQSKAIAYNYKAVATTQEPKKPYLEINVSGNKRLVDTLGITQKLDREGGDASNVKVAFNDGTDADELKSGNTLSKLFGGIKKWLDRKVDKIDGKGLSDENFTKEEKEKLGKIEKEANNYTLPAATTTTRGGIKVGTGLVASSGVLSHSTAAGYKHIPSGGSSGQYLKNKSSGEAQWATPTAAEIGAASSTHTHNAATQSAAGFMSAADKTKLDACVKVHYMGYCTSSGTLTKIAGDLSIRASKMAEEGLYYVSGIGNGTKDRVLLIHSMDNNVYVRYCLNSVNGTSYIYCYDFDNNLTKTSFMIMVIGV